MAEKVEGPYNHIDSRHFAPDAEFDPRPSALILVAGLEIVVRDDYGDYLLIISPNYEPIELPKERRSTKVEDGFWTIPYVTKTVNAPTGGFRHVASTIETVDREVKEWDAQGLLEEYIRKFAFGIPKITPVGGFCELKHSWTQPHITKLYHIMRFSVALTSCAHRNLADASSRKGYGFLPIDDRYKTVTRRRTCQIHRLKETLYLEQPLATNLSTILENDRERRALRTRCAVTFDKTHFMSHNTGLLFCGDLAGYSAASAYAEEHMGGLTEADHGAILRDSATVAFTDLFLEAGIWQIHTAGDGFICAMPLDRPSEAPSALKRFASAYATYLKRLDELNLRIYEYWKKNSTKDAVPLLGSRLAIHHGEYRYGKMSLAASLGTGFDGSEIVRVTRLEQGLSAAIKDTDLSTKYKVSDNHHTAAASRTVVSLLGSDKVVLPKLFKTAGLFDAKSKKFHDKAWLLRAINAPAEYNRYATRALTRSEP